MSDELKPCPFCGDEAPTRRWEGGHFFSVVCFCPKSPEIRASQEEANFNWNTRPIEDALRAQLSERDERIAELERKLAEAYSALAIIIHNEGLGILNDTYHETKTIGDLPAVRRALGEEK